MASNLANLLVSAFGGVAKPPLPAPVKPAAPDDKFARLIDAQAPAPETPAVESSPPAEKPAEAPVDGKAIDETAAAASAEGTKVDDTEDDDSSGETSLADSLLTALAALGINTDGLTAKGGALDLNDPAALKDIKDALGELAQILGLDAATLMQQLAQLAKDVPASGGLAGSTDLAGKLTAWLSEKLGTPGAALPAGAEDSLKKLLAGLEQLAKPVPLQPNLGNAELTLPVSGADAADAAKPLSTEPEIKVETDALQHSDRKKDVEASDAGQKAQPNPQQAAKANGNGDNALNLAAAAQGQQADPTPATGDTTLNGPRLVQSGYQTSQQQLNLPQLAFEMSRQVQDGNTRFQIRLDPPELGRIDVKLEIDNRGHVHAKLTVEKAETLDLMQRDQRALERALQQAGLDQSKTNLEFSLKQNPFAGDQNQGSGNGQGGSGGSQAESEEIEAPVPAITLYRGALQASGVNIIA
ncbi:flagellar hook-length control protein FliK [Devosia soli]|uniref:flagellar hook-length control protein FliK n=1 Tax=Devosia soli TaxID=361041 RepID=UPI000AB7D0C8|nr:flagellar hook-length control protein FliK [Devosia soli]